MKLDHPIVLSHAGPADGDQHNDRKIDGLKIIDIVTGVRNEASSSAFRDGFPTEWSSYRHRPKHSLSSDTLFIVIFCIHRSFGCGYARRPFVCPQQPLRVSSHSLPRLWPTAVAAIRPPRPPARYDSFLTSVVTASSICLSFRPAASSSAHLSHMHHTPYRPVQGSATGGSLAAPLEGGRGFIRTF